MAKLRSLDQGKVIKIIESNGFRHERSGKHLTYKKADSNGKVWTTWIPRHNSVSLFVIKYIIKQTGKPREEFY